MMKKIKFNKKYCGMAAVALATIGLASCNNELNEADLGNTGDVTVNGISLAKLPDIKAWSGNETLGNSIQTRSVDVNANMWDKTWDCPVRPAYDIEGEELEELKELLSKGKETHNTITLPFENYYVQQIYKGEDTYPGMNKQNPPAQVGEEILGSDHMDKLIAWNPHTETIYGDPANNYQPYEGTVNYEHVNNFNHGTNNNTPGACGCGKVHSGTTLMTGMPTTDIDPETQFGFHESWGTSHDYNNYIIVEYKGYYYVGFDYEAHKYDQTSNNAGEAYNIERDWNFTDWIVRIIPAYHKGLTPETPTVPTEPSDPDNGDQIVGVKTTSEVEVNLAINDYDPTASREEGIADVVTKLSIHVRAATDVKVVIPIPAKYLCDADDLIILEKHLEELTAHGGATTENVVNYPVGKSNVELHSEIDFEKGLITVWTVGINEEVIEYCISKNGDGINFEIWNYFNNSAFDDFANAKEELQEHLNKATIEFMDSSYPDYYINAYNVTESGEKFEWDCIVSIIDAQQEQFGDAKEDLHLNGSEFNKIYKNKDFDGDDGAHDHDFLWYLTSNTSPEE